LLLSLLLLLGHGTGEDRLGTLARQLWNSNIAHTRKLR
jgi:hypothetical protein